jgi:hypothetical protein
MSSWCFFCRSKAPAWSLQAQLWAGEARPPRLARMAGGAPPPCSRLRRARGSPTHSCGSFTGLPPVTQKKNQEGQKAEAGRQRASEPPLFTHLSLARASMKIWCFRKRDTAIKWCENATVSAFRVSLIERDCGVSEQTTIKWDTFLTFRIPL